MRHRIRKLGSEVTLLFQEPKPQNLYLLSLFTFLPNQVTNKEENGWGKISPTQLVIY